MSLQEKLDERMRLVTEAREILDSADAEERALTAEETEKYDRIDSDIDRLTDEITAIRATTDRRSRLADIEKVIDDPTPARSHVRFERSHLTGPLSRSSSEYRAIMERYFRHGREGLEPSEVRALQIGTDSEGGFLTADEFDRTLRTTMDDFNAIRDLANVIATTGDRKIPVETTLGTAGYVGEEGAYTGVESDPAFGQVVLDAFKLGTMVRVSEELLNDDIVNIESELASMIARRFANREEEAFAVGTGSGQPTGLTAQASAGHTTASAGSIAADELFEVQHALKAPYRRRATWLFADSTVKAIRLLKDADNQYLWRPGLVAGVEDTLLGSPVRTSSGMPEIGTGNVTALYGDFSYVTVADRGPTVVQRLNEVYAINGQVGFRAYMRHDMKLTLAESMVKLTQA